MRNIEYGKYTLDSLGFAFFNDRMYKATMFFHISSFEDFEKDLTYHELIKLFDEKYLRYSQGYIYCDIAKDIYIQMIVLKLNAHIIHQTTSIHML